MASEPSKKKSKKAEKASKSEKPMTFARMASEHAKQQKAFEKRKPKPTPKANAVIKNPELEGDDLSQEERFAVVLGIAQRIYEHDEAELFERYHMHFAKWRANAQPFDVKVASGLIFPEVDEGNLDNLGRVYAILPFIFVNDSEVAYEAAKMVCIHHPVVGKDRLFGPRLVLESVVGRYEADGEPSDEVEADTKACSVASAIAAVMSCGDKRLTPLLEDAWKKLPPSARLHLSLYQDSIPTEIEAEFWLKRAAEAKPGSADFKLAIEHLILMADGKSRTFALFADFLTQNEFNFGLERGADEIRKTSKVEHDKFLNQHIDLMGRIESSPLNQPFVVRLLEAWGCTEA
jgi:hypothetical protein